jgi:hypothetical protein
MSEPTGEPIGFRVGVLAETLMRLMMHRSEVTPPPEDWPSWIRGRALCDLARHTEFKDVLAWIDEHNDKCVREFNDQSARIQEAIGHNPNMSGDETKSRLAAYFAENPLSRGASHIRWEFDSEIMDGSESKEHSLWLMFGKKNSTAMTEFKLLFSDRFSIDTLYDDSEVIGDTSCG